MRRFIIISILVCLLALISSSVSAQEDRVFHRPCLYTDGAYYQGDIFPRYEFRNQRLVLVDWTTGEIVQVVEENLLTPEFSNVIWSPDCRYMSGSLQRMDSETIFDTVFWDLTSGSRVGVFEGQNRGHARIDWSPTSDRAVVQTRNGVFLWLPISGEQRFMFDAIHQSIYGNTFRFWGFYWDDARREILGLSVNNDIGIFDMDSGELITTLTNPDWAGNGAFFTSDDNSRLVTYTLIHGGYLAVWDRDTYTETRLSTDGHTANGGWQVALSPDNRYVVVGINDLRVWDLQNLAENWQDRDPIAVYGGPSVAIGRIYFISPTVVETSSVAGLERWDILTGEQLP